MALGKVGQEIGEAVSGVIKGAGDIVGTAVEVTRKTMVDALTPAIDAMKQALQDGAEASQMLEKAVEAAEQGMHATIPLQAKKGRASYLGERSIGHQDPGATSAYLLFKTACDAWS